MKLPLAGSSMLCRPYKKGSQAQHASLLWPRLLTPMMAYADCQAPTPEQALQQVAARTQGPVQVPSNAGFPRLPDVPDWGSELRALSLAGHVVFHGPREQVLPFFARLGFQLPGRKGIADFLQEVTSKKDQRVSLPSPALHALLLSVAA